MYLVRSIVVIGGSAGAIDTLCRILKNLSPELPAAIAVVIHVGQGSEDLATLFKRCNGWPVVTPRNPQPLKPGVVLIAPADRHLLVRPGRIDLSSSPPENTYRPSIDSLFRSAARSYRQDVIAVVLSGMLDDGTGGAVAVQSRGGRIIVQDPATAPYPDLPTNVLRYIKADHTIPIEAIAPTIV